jgi:exopolyphosphatase/guanosine-5'-triphosphate,3'-diphosphate pyrophosphatase
MRWPAAVELAVRRACIDIGSNTTRLLVADCTGEALVELHQDRAFTLLGRGRLPDGSIEEAKIRQVAEVVAGQLHTARVLGARQVRVVATAAIRSAPNRSSLAAAVREACGLEVEILSDQEEARLAFVGVARTLRHRSSGPLGVVDVGGGSSELVVGNPPGEVTWWASFAVGSGELAQRCLTSDPPGEGELADARRVIAGTLGGIEVPRPTEAAAVGGSAASLGTLAGPLLDGPAFDRSLSLLASRPAADIAHRFGLDEQRVRLLPAGLLILQAAGEHFGQPLRLGGGGVREGVLLESAGG